MTCVSVNEQPVRYQTERQQASLALYNTGRSVGRPPVLARSALERSTRDLARRSADRSRRSIMFPKIPWENDCICYLSTHLPTPTLIMRHEVQPDWRFSSPIRLLKRRRVIWDWTAWPAQERQSRPKSGSQWNGFSLRPRRIRRFLELFQFSVLRKVDRKVSSLRRSRMTRRVSTYSGSEMQVASMCRYLRCVQCELWTSNMGHFASGQWFRQDKGHGGTLKTARPDKNCHGRVATLTKHNALLMGLIKLYHSVQTEHRLTQRNWQWRS